MNYDAVGNTVMCSMYTAMFIQYALAGLEIEWKSLKRKSKTDLVRVVPTEWLF